MSVRPLFLLVLGLLSGCAEVHVFRCKNVDCSSVDTVDGIRYYEPRPYLLVAEAPAETVQVKISQKKGDTTMTLLAGDQDSGKGNGDKSGGAGDGGSTSPGGASNTSFGLATKQYQLKLIYLPDMAHPMLLKMKPGLFGSAEVKPQLQDGWMLTGLDATADSKTADTLTAIAGFLHGGGSSSTGSSKSSKSSSAAAMAAKAISGAGDASAKDTESPPWLPPGLYEIDFLDGAGAGATGSFSGKVTGLKLVARFCQTGVVNGENAICH